MALNWLKRFFDPTRTLGVAFAIVAALPQANAASLKTQNVFLIISDGFRWQEVFNGAEADLMTKENGGVRNTNALRAEFWRDTPEARRQALLPFFWTEIARHGQLYGNQAKGSVATLTNGKKFSYPGYNEILAGFGDPRIDSNKKIPNPNVTVFEWLHERPGFRQRVVAFGSWDVFPYIFNYGRSRLPVWPGWETKFENREISVPALVPELMRDTTPIWDDLILDSFLFHAALDHVKKKQPRLMFLGFGETDEWAHEGRYDLYLRAAHHVDRFIKALWETVQASPQYRDKTTLIITCDHGRGSGPSDWKNHGEKIAGAEGIWIAIIGPDTPPLGERVRSASITQSQIAATIATLLSEDFHVAFPRTGAPIAEAIGPARK